MVNRAVQEIIEQQVLTVAKALDDKLNEEIATQFPQIHQPLAQTVAWPTRPSFIDSRDGIAVRSHCWSLGIRFGSGFRVDGSLFRFCSSTSIWRKMLRWSTIGSHWVWFDLILVQLRSLGSGSNVGGV